MNNRPHRLMKTSSIAVETSRSTTQSDSIVGQTNKRSSCQFNHSYEIRWYSIRLHYLQQSFTMDAIKGLLIIHKTGLQTRIPLQRLFDDITKYEDMFRLASPKPETCLFDPKHLIHGIMQSSNRYSTNNLC